MEMKQIIILFISLIINLEAQDFAEKVSGLVTVFPIGETSSSLGYQVQPDSDFRWPTTICFDSDGNLVVSDFLNKRISIFDQNWEALRTVALDHYFSPSIMKIDSEGNYIGYLGQHGIIKFDKEGNTIFFLDVIGEEVVVEDALKKTIPDDIGNVTTQFQLTIISLLRLNYGVLEG